MQMNILAIDTAGAGCLVGIMRRDGAIFTRTETEGQSHSRCILALLDTLLREADLALADLQLIAWSAGPGSFTGIRIAASVVQSLVYSLQIPFLSLSSLEVMAYAAVPRLLQLSALTDTDRTIHVAVDARMNGVYWASFCVHGAVLQRVNEDQLITKDEFLQRSQSDGSDTMIVGDAGREYLGQSIQEACLVADERSADAILALALTKPASAWCSDVSQCLPHYVQPATSWQKRERIRQ